jgi:hypothetical protein
MQITFPKEKIDLKIYNNTPYFAMKDDICFNKVVLNMNVFDCS